MSLAIVLVMMQFVPEHILIQLTNPMADRKVRIATLAILAILLLMSKALDIIATQTSRYN